MPIFVCAAGSQAIVPRASLRGNYPLVSSGIQSNLCMEDGPFVDDLSVKDGGFP